MKYNWQQSDWPNFQFQIQDSEGLLRSYLQNAGKLEGALRSLKDSERDESITELLIAEAIKTSEIEGEFLSRADVASSIRKQLGMSMLGESKDRRAQGIAEAIISARKTFESPLTEATLFDWHSSLLAHNQGLRVGSWRTHQDPMQIVSGAMGFERIHFEAPPSSFVEREMTHFLEWFNSTAPQGPDEMVHAPVGLDASLPKKRWPKPLVIRDFRVYPTPSNKTRRSTTCNWKRRSARTRCRLG